MEQISTTDSARDLPPSGDAEPPEPLLRVLVANEQTILPVNTERIEAAVRLILRESHFQSALVSIAIVDDDTIHELNRRHLDHDYPTDVLSFPLEETEDSLEGEVVVSAQTAAEAAAENGVQPADELLLYVVHGTLHLVGYRDKLPAEIAKMRAAEQEYLSRLGVDDSFSIHRETRPS